MQIKTEHIGAESHNIFIPQIQERASLSAAMDVSLPKMKNTPLQLFPHLRGIPINNLHYQVSQIVYIRQVSQKLMLLNLSHHTSK